MPEIERISSRYFNMKIQASQIMTKYSRRVQISGTINE